MSRRTYSPTTELGAAAIFAALAAFSLALAAYLLG
jgi:hypothetical protein